jgi:hypothetical protein
MPDVALWGRDLVLHTAFHYQHAAVFWKSEWMNEWMATYPECLKRDGSMISSASRRHFGSIGWKVRCRKFSKANANINECAVVKRQRTNPQPSSAHCRLTRSSASFKPP